MEAVLVLAAELDKLQQERDRLSKVYLQTRNSVEAKIDELLAFLDEQGFRYVWVNSKKKYMLEDEAKWVTSSWCGFSNDYGVLAQKKE